MQDSTRRGMFCPNHMASENVFLTRKVASNCHDGFSSKWIPGSSHPETWSNRGPCVISWNCYIKTSMSQTFYSGFILPVLQGPMSCSLPNKGWPLPI